MKTIGVISSNIISPLGNNTSDNFKALLAGQTGIELQNNGTYAAVIQSEDLYSLNKNRTLSSFSKFEKLAIRSISDAIADFPEIIQDRRTLFILSTTKGNIDMISQNGLTNRDQLNLSSTANKIAAHFKTENKALVISTACISGLLSILVAQRLIRSGRYDHAVICGVDLYTDFVQAGFHSFMALSDTICKPYDAARNGINLGEAAATLVISKDAKFANNESRIRLGEGASSNDANHISGPSRTGAELSLAVDKAIHRSGLQVEDIGFISAHGTATIYNDEMESKAFNISKLSNIPVNSLKSCFGHTLGAAGLLESIISIESMKHNTILPTLGWTQSGVSMPLNVNNQLIHKPIQHFLKTTSGFGGCNAAMIFSKNY